MMDLFAQALGLLESGVPGLEQLGQQLLQQLPSAFQQLGQRFQDGALTIRQAIDDAAKDIGNHIQSLENTADHVVWRTEKISALSRRTPRIRGSGPLGPTGPECDYRHPAIGSTGEVPGIVAGATNEPVSGSAASGPVLPRSHH